MHRVGSAGNTAGSSRPRKEKRFTYVLNDADNKKHCAGINCLSYLNASASGTSDYLFTGSRDGTLKRWEYQNGDANFSATFESHVDWINDAIIVGQNLVSCSSDTTLKVWNCLADGACTKTLRQHSDYVICLAAAEKNSNIVASGGLGGEVFIWDLDAAIAPIAKSVDAKEDEVPNGNSGPALSTLCNVSSSGNIVSTNGKSHGYSPIAAKGHKDSVYALDMNDTGTLLVSGGTEKVVRVWDPRTGSKNMKLRGHTDNIRALLIDSTGRYCLSGSSDSMIRLWDLGQQRCVHSYAVHTDSVWALASTPSFGHVYSGGRDQSVYLTDLSTRESVLLCTNEHPILQLSLQDDTIWVATTDSSVYGWPAEGQSPQKVFQKGGSFLAGNLSFSRARASLEGSAPVPVYKEPSFTIPGVPAIVQHEIMNNRRHVLTKDTVGSVKLWEITRGAVIEDFGKVSFDDKKKELFEMVSIPAWFTMDARLGCLSVHLDTPQCFSAEIYAVDLNVTGAQEDLKINLAHETLRGLLVHWSKRRPKPGPHSLSNGDSSIGKDVSLKNLPHPRSDVDDGSENHANNVLPSFEFSTVSPPSIITESSSGGPWRKRITDLDGTEDDLPWWCVDCAENGRFPKENTKCGFYLHPAEGSPAPNITQGKLSAPRILRVLKVANYVVEKLVLEKPLDGSPHPPRGRPFSSLPPSARSQPDSGERPYQRRRLRFRRADMAVAAPGQLNLDEFPSWGSRGVDCFEKLEQIGEGTYGQVYMAKETETNEIVALKKIRMDNEREGFPITAIREIKILKKLHHQNVIQLKEIVTSPGPDRDEQGKPIDGNKYKGSIYMVFEYMDHDLTGLADRPGMRFTVPQIKCYMKQLLTGLHYCHVNQVLHRDIKGSNLLIDNEGNLKLADFGLARSFSSDHNGNLTNRVITLWYRPPELLLGSTRYGPAVDMWSVGCIFAELLNGKPILPGKNEPEQLTKIFELCGTPDELIWPGVTKMPWYNNFKPPRVLKRKVKDAFKHFDRHALDLLEKMLTLDPTQRIPAKEALDAEYFWTDPLPCDPKSLPSYEASHEFQTKKKRQQQRQAEEAAKRQKINHPPPHSRLPPIQHPGQSHQIRPGHAPSVAGGPSHYAKPRGPGGPNRYPQGGNQGAGYNNPNRGGQGSGYGSAPYPQQGRGPPPFPAAGGPRGSAGSGYGVGGPNYPPGGPPYGASGPGRGGPNYPQGGSRNQQQYGSWQ